uniref:THAP domain-containing protein 1 n=1 Tax=Electrophorus electricus TaxID=8005 RepID=A0A4W4GKM7_ELEEL
SAVWKCIVPGCSNTNTSTRFHSFPLSNGALCRSWLQSIRHPTFLSDTDVKVIRQERLMVCSDHFVVADYKGRCLKDGAVPSVFPWTAIRVEMLSLLIPTPALLLYQCSYCYMGGYQGVLWSETDQ